MFFYGFIIYFWTCSFCLNPRGNNGFGGWRLLGYLIISKQFPFQWLIARDFHRDSMNIHVTRLLMIYSRKWLLFCLRRSNLIFIRRFSSPSLLAFDVFRRRSSWFISPWFYLTIKGRLVNFDGGVCIVESAIGHRSWSCIYLPRVSTLGFWDVYCFTGHLMTMANSFTFKNLSVIDFPHCAP